MAQRLLLSLRSSLLHRARAAPSAYRRARAPGSLECSGFTARAFSAFDKSFFDNAFSAIENMTPEQMRAQAKLIASDDVPMQMRLIPLAKRQEMAQQLNMLADNPAMLKMMVDQAKNMDAGTLNKAFDTFGGMFGGAASSFASKFGGFGFGGGGKNDEPASGALPGAEAEVIEEVGVEEVDTADNVPPSTAGSTVRVSRIRNIDPASVADMPSKDIVKILVEHGVDFSDCLDSDSLKRSACGPARLQQHQCVHVVHRS
eukprot:INCI13137.2.p1 GENE.INCI13137.2~~INCI13137.2.p1  ORF type:complete len:258 (-),score=48.75 INCI13137.2:373-1146(-)